TRQDRPIHIPFLADLSSWLTHLEKWNLLLFCVGFMLLRTVLDALFSHLSAARMTALGQHVIFDIRTALFDHVQRLSLGFFDSQRSGDLVTRFTSDSNNIEDMLVAAVSISLTNSLTIVATVAVMVGIDWQLTLVAFGVLPFLFFMNRY